MEGGEGSSAKLGSHTDGRREAAFKFESGSLWLQSPGAFAAPHWRLFISSLAHGGHDVGKWPPFPICPLGHRHLRAFRL